jgi:hypothetical protein
MAEENEERDLDMQTVMKRLAADGINLGEGFGGNYELFVVGSDLFIVLGHSPDVLSFMKAPCEGEELMAVPSPKEDTSQDSGDQGTDADTHTADTESIEPDACEDLLALAFQGSAPLAVAHMRLGNLRLVIGHEAEVLYRRLLTLHAG